MTFPIRKGYRIEPNLVQKATELQEMGIISLAEIRSAICSRCSSTHRQDGNVEGQLMHCSCGNRIKTDQFKHSEASISEIHYGKIRQLLTNILQPFGFIFENDRRLFVCENKYVIIVGMSVHNFIIASGGTNCFFVTLDSERAKLVVPNHWKNRTFWLPDFLSIDNSLLERQLKALELIVQPQQENLAQVITRSPTYFEQKFVPHFLGQLKEKNRDLQVFLQHLHQNKNSLVNAKIIPLGGAGNPDFYTIDLYDYLTAGLEPAKYGEAKRYGSSTLTFAEYSKAFTHSMGSENLIIASTNNVQIGIWTNIIEQMYRNKRYSIVLIDKDLLLLLASTLGIQLRSDL